MRRHGIGANLACLLLLATPARAEPRVVQGESFAVTLPDGYRDVSAFLRDSGFPRPQVTFEDARERIIAFQKVPVYGGNLADATICRRTAASVAAPKGKVRSAAIVPGPTGPTCQIDILYPEAVALLTDVNGARETWLMTCNYADGDSAGEGACRATLASLAPRQGFGRPDPLTTWLLALIENLSSSSYR